MLVERIVGHLDPNGDILMSVLGDLVALTVEHARALDAGHRS